MNSLPPTGQPAPDRCCPHDWSDHEIYDDLLGACLYDGCQCEAWRDGIPVRPTTRFQAIGGDRVLLWADSATPDIPADPARGEAVWQFNMRTGEVSTKAGLWDAGALFWQAVAAQMPDDLKTQIAKLDAEIAQRTARVVSLGVELAKLEPEAQLARQIMALAGGQLSGGLLRPLEPPHGP